MPVVLALTWLAVLAVLAACGAPLAAWLFPRLPDRGAAFALPVTLLSTALVAFLVGQVAFGLPTMVLGVLVTLGASLLAYRRGADPDWHAVARAFGVFAVGFAILALFRASNPGIVPAGGEQFLHFGLTKSLARAGSLPPEDFWFAGEPLRYYYGTQMQVTGLSMLTGTPLREGYNLALATFYGVLFVGAYGLAGAITAARGRSARLGGALGAFFAAIGGALTTAVRLGFGLLPEELALEYGEPAFGAIRHKSYEEAVLEQSDPAEWGWFLTRYVVPDTLQEFPMYSFVKGDLHGHALSTGYVVLAAALAYSYYTLPAERRGRRAAVLFGGLGAVAGVFGFMNTWSLPTAVGLAWLAVAAADAHPVSLLPARIVDRFPGVTDDGLRFGGEDDSDTEPDGGPGAARVADELSRLALAVVPAALVGAIGVALASPFLIFGHVPTNEGIGFLPPRTSLWPFLILYGGLLALFTAYLLSHGWGTFRRTGGWLVLPAALLLIAAFPVLALTAPLLAGAWVLVRTDRIGFEGVLLVAGVGLLLAMDLVHAKVAPWNQVRWNTTLKVAVQGWTLAGVAAGATGAILLADARGALTTVRDRDAAPESVVGDGGTPARSAASVILAGVLVVALVAASSPFAVLVGASQIGGELTSDAEFSFDGLATHDRWKGDQTPAIHWLDEREGRPVVVEAPGDDAYDWTSPASTLTGLPTVVGWENHQENYRGEAAVARRVDQVDAIYAGPWANASAALREHDVAYVYVGPNERARYGDSLRSFGERDAFSVATTSENVTVYAVDQGAFRQNATALAPDVAEETEPYRAYSGDPTSAGRWTPSSGETAT